MTTQRSFAVKRATTGLGFFALQPFPPNKRIIRYTGTVITNEEADKKGGKYLFGIDKHHTIDGNNRKNTARYINHSCRPNAEAISVGIQIWIWSKKAIRVGEEITINYGKEYFNEHIRHKGCKCKKCVARSIPQSD
ncbi:MAG: hypothetical protein NVSMB56_01760 [Pyrinomonadaceae bacterium]